MLEVIEIGPLFGAPGPERDDIDAAVGAAASTVGVLLISGPAGSVPSGAATRESLLRVFSLAPAQQRALWRRSYAPENEAVYRGWSPRGGEVAVDIYDLGPDIAHPRGEASDDPLLGPSPAPGGGTAAWLAGGGCGLLPGDGTGRSGADALARSLARPARDGLRRRLRRRDLDAAADALRAGARAAAGTASRGRSRGGASTSTRAS